MCACRPTWTLSMCVYAFSTQKGLISDRSPLTHVKLLRKENSLGKLKTNLGSHRAKSQTNAKM